MADDRGTAIFGDQIADGTITPDEFDSSNSPSDTNILSWDAVAEQMKWIASGGFDSMAFVFGRRSANTTNIYLRSFANIPSNLVPIILPYDTTLIAISAATRVNETWTAEVRLNGSVVSGAALSISGASSGYNTYDIDFDAGDGIQVYCNGNNINRPIVLLVFKKR